MKTSTMELLRLFPVVPKWCRMVRKTNGKLIVFKVL